MQNGIDKIMPYVLPVFIVIMGVFYYLVNPVMQHYPLKCIWKVLTGTQCPACGFQRAVYALVHGNYWEALSYNYFFVISIPLAFTAVLAEWYNYHHKLDFLHDFLHNQYTLKSYVVLYFAWWVIRNFLNI